MCRDECECLIAGLRSEYVVSLFAEFVPETVARGEFPEYQQQCPSSDHLSPSSGTTANPGRPGLVLHSGCGGVQARSRRIAKAQARPHAAAKQGTPEGGSFGRQSRLRASQRDTAAAASIEVARAGAAPFSRASRRTRAGRSACACGRAWSARSRADVPLPRCFPRWRAGPARSCAPPARPDSAWPHPRSTPCQPRLRK